MTELKRTDLSVLQERAVLVGVLTPGTAVDLRNPLAELQSLAEAAGARVVDGLIQKRNTFCAATCIGKGKLEELHQRCQANDATVIIFDNDLTPGQIRNVEEQTHLKILDRSELILDIFAGRARTHEARLQVELAQLQYTAPRLRGMWTHLERVAGAGGATGAGVVGGIGTRGPGERQIEIDRRIVGERVAHLKREIARIDRRKSREVKSRENEFTVSLVGYTNSGKSTLMNALTDAGREVRDALFVTLDTKTVRWHLDDRHTALLSDTVGFVRDLPHRLVASFRATLEEAIHADLLLHVVDATAPDAAGQIEAVEGVLHELGCNPPVADPTVTLFNKVDAVEDISVVHVLENRIPRSLRISARTGEGLDRLVEGVLGQMKTGTVDTVLRVPIADGKLVATIDEAAEVHDRHYDGQEVRLTVSIDRRRLAQLTGRYPQLHLDASAL
ncbi:MAG: GTPase HflX [Planctomycetota bacterium]